MKAPASLWGGSPCALGRSQPTGLHISPIPRCLGDAHSTRLRRSEEGLRRSSDAEGSSRHSFCSQKHAALVSAARMQQRFRFLSTSVASARDICSHPWEKGAGCPVPVTVRQEIPALSHLLLFCQGDPLKPYPSREGLHSEDLSRELSLLYSQRLTVQRPAKSPPTACTTTRHVQCLLALIEQLGDPHPSGASGGGRVANFLGRLK